MKKLLALATSAALAACVMMTGCSGGSSSSSASSEAGSDSAATSTPATAASQAEAKYAVTIDDCQVTTDYQGAPAIIVTYTWTNNSEDATSFLTAVSAKAFQNGVQLDTAIGAGADSNATMNQIKPGATNTVQQAYVLDDQSDVTVECTELISFDDTVIAEKTFSVA